MRAVIFWFFVQIWIGSVANAAEVTVCPHIDGFKAALNVYLSKGAVGYDTWVNDSRAPCKRVDFDFATLTSSERLSYQMVTRRKGLEFGFYIVLIDGHQYFMAKILFPFHKSSKIVSLGGPKALLNFYAKNYNY